ncbi:hypothetical protein G7046_g5743 [Stylonectria norvegica]|nr:hypothetical protein G7046_g5743 [Stylonectria norvegica]
MAGRIDMARRRRQLRRAGSSPSHPAPPQPRRESYPSFSPSPLGQSGHNTLHLLSQPAVGTPLEASPVQSRRSSQPYPVRASTVLPPPGFTEAHRGQGGSVAVLPPPGFTEAYRGQDRMIRPPPGFTEADRGQGFRFPRTSPVSQHVEENFVPASARSVNFSRQARSRPSSSRGFGSLRRLVRSSASASESVPAPVEPALIEASRASISRRIQASAEATRQTMQEMGRRLSARRGDHHSPNDSDKKH